MCNIQRSFNGLKRSIIVVANQSLVFIPADPLNVLLAFSPDNLVRRHIYHDELIHPVSY
jgi:hypothetical protein